MQIAYVLWIPWRTYRGGGEEYAENLCRHLALRGHDVILISPPAELQANIGKTRRLLVSGPEKGLWSLIRSASKLQANMRKTRSIAIRNVSIRRVISGLAMGLWSFNIPRILSKVDPDVVISHNIFPPYFCQKWANKHGKVFINNFFHMEPRRKELVLSWRHRLFKLLNLRRGNHIYVAISYYQKQLIERFKDEVHYIGMGYDPHKPSSLPKENVVLYLGKIDKIKQVPLLLRAWKNVDHDNWKLVLAGDGSDYDYCVNYAKNINLTDYEFVGYVTDEEKWMLYSKAKLFAFPSLYEGFGIVLLEALNEKSVPIVNNSPPMNEIITPQVGFLTNPTVHAWAKTLRTAMNSDLTEKLVHAPKILGKYKWDAVCKRLEQVIKTYTQVNRSRLNLFM